MIHGHVLNRQALIPVRFVLPHQPDILLEFIVDTSFSGFLVLPPAAVQAMQLPYAHHTAAALADESEIQVPVHGATILWEGEEREVRVLAIGKRPLLGAALLDRLELSALFREGGPVTLDDPQID